MLQDTTPQLNPSTISLQCDALTFRLVIPTFDNRRPRAMALEPIDIPALWTAVKSPQNWTVDRGRSGTVSLIPHHSGPTLVLAAEQCIGLPCGAVEGLPVTLSVYHVRRDQLRLQATRSACYWSV